MTRKSIRETISAYMENDVPQQVKDSFETWITDPEGFEEKNGILEELWDSMPASGKSSGLPSAAGILEEAEELQRTEKHARRRARDLPLWISSVAAVILAVVCASLIFRGNEMTTCLASGESSKSIYTLPDGTEVYLNRNSRLYYSGNLDGRKREVKLVGEGFFDVCSDPEHPFIVEAHGMEIAALGTEFTVTAYSDEHISAYLQKGSIKISGPDLKDAVMLNPDQAVTYDKASGIYTKKSVNASNHTAWKEDRLSFQNTSLHDIMESLSHWYQIKITCNDEAFAQTTKLSLTVRQESVTEIFDAMTALIPSMSFSLRGNHLTVSRK